MSIKSYFAKRSLAAFEKRYDYDATYMRELLRDSPTGFWKFVRFMPLAGYRREAPLEVYFVAKITSVASEDCGPCFELGLKQAREAGVSPDVLRAVMDDGRGLSEELAEVRRFALDVVGHRVSDNGLVERLRERYGAEAMAELALAIASVRIFPAVKRAMGHNPAGCSTIRLAV